MSDKYKGRDVELKNHIPHFLREAEPFSGVFDALNQELNTADEAFNLLKDQFIISKAEKGLKHWETFLGIPVDELKSADFRRSVILSKIRGVGKVTKDFLEKTCKSFENGSLEVVEYPAQSRLVLKFTELNGVPPNFKDFENFVREVIPAHLTYEFVNKYNTHAVIMNFVDGVTNKNIRHNDLKTMTYKEIRETNKWN